MIDIEVTYERDRTHRLRFIGTKEPCIPAVGMNLPWEYSRPAEGGEFEAHEIRVIRGDRERKLPAKTVRALMWDPEKFPAAVDAALEAMWS